MKVLFWERDYEKYLDQQGGSYCSRCGYEGHPDRVRCPVCGAPMIEEEGDQEEKKEDW